MVSFKSLEGVATHSGIRQRNRISRQCSGDVLLVELLDGGQVRIAPRALPPDAACP